MLLIDTYRKYSTHQKTCSEVKVEVGEKNNTPVKYIFGILILNYGSEVILIS